MAKVESVKQFHNLIEQAEGLWAWDRKSDHSGAQPSIFATTEMVLSVCIRLRAEDANTRGLALTWWS